MKTETLSERQQQIVEAALRIIASKGARRFTADLLAAEIGVTGGAIYRHFESMTAIVDAVIDRMESMLFAGFPPSASDPIERLRLFFKHRTQTVLRNPDISRLLLSDNVAQTAGAAQAKRLHAFKRRSQSFVLECLRESERAGTLRGGISPAAGAIVVLGSVLALSHASARVGGELRSEELADQVWTVVESALRAKRRRARRAVRGGSTQRGLARGRGGGGRQDAR